MQHCAVFISAESLYMFRAQAPITGVFKTSTAANGTCVIVAGKSSRLLIRAFLCRFYFCRVTLHVSDTSAHHQEYLKLVQRPLVHVFCKIYNILR